MTTGTCRRPTPRGLLGGSLRPGDRAFPDRAAAALGGKARWAILGEPGPRPTGSATTIRRRSPARLDYARAVKTPYEIECMALATVAGVRAHRAAEAGFRAGASEYEIHLAYCRAAGAREEELPYNNIIAFDTPCGGAALPGAGPQPPGGREVLPDRRRRAARGLCLRHHAHLRRGAGRVPGPDRRGRRGAAEARGPRAAGHRLPRHPPRGAPRDRRRSW